VCERERERERECERECVCGRERAHCGFRLQAGSGAVKKGSAAGKKPSLFGKVLSQTGALTDKKAGMKFEISGVGPDGKKSHGNGVAAEGGAEGFALELSCVKDCKMGIVDAVAAVKVCPPNFM